MTDSSEEAFDAWAENPETLSQVDEGVTPWPHPVDGTELLNELAGYFSGPVVLPMGGAETCALYAIMTHLTSMLDLVPYLNVRSEVKRSGKSIVGTLMRHVVRRPVLTANASPAYLYRQTGEPTFIIDEGDTFVALSDELGGILNAGYARDMTVGRTAQHGRDFVPVDLNPFGPKVICGIGDLPETIQDRSIILDLRRKKPTDRVDRFNRRMRKVYRERGDLLKQMIVRWIADSWDKLDQHDPMVPEDLDDRAHDNWEPLLMVADVAAGAWSVRARNVARTLSALRDQVGELELLLTDVQAIFNDSQSYVHIDRDGHQWTMPGHLLTPTELTRRLVAIEERPWSSYGSTNRAITTDMVGKLLGRAKVQSKPTRVEALGGRVVRLYWMELFTDAWERHGTCATCEEPWQV